MFTLQAKVQHFFSKLMFYVRLNGINHTVNVFHFSLKYFMTFMWYGTVRHGHTGPSLQSVLNLLPSSLDHSLVGSDCSTTPKQTCAASISVNIRLMLDTRIYLIMPLTQLHLHLHICYTDMDLAQFSSTILHSSGHICKSNIVCWIFISRHILPACISFITSCFHYFTIYFVYLFA